MNQSYPRAEASDMLDTFLVQSPMSRSERRIMHLTDIQVDAYELFVVSEPPSIRLKSVSSTEMEEVDFRVRGILCQSYLPPMSRVNEEYKAGFLRQTFHLTACKSDSPFFNYFPIVDQVVDLFRRGFPTCTFAAPTIPRFESRSCILTYNPYFSKRKDTPNSESVPFGPGVDPKGVLEKYQPQNMHHTSDNRVRYFQRTVDEDNCASLKDMNPIVFQNGDIVEVRFSFVAHTTKTYGHYQVCMTARALVLLHDKFRQASSHNGGNGRSVVHHALALPLKRNDYSDEEDRENKKMRT
ncbi:hypothetical protein GALMADRAFT_142201 [Galerina marginata CBS 339.88]|uniref:Uncharacterized protein n=1 Tax=Galerina marginata (strain CBS 339.88) TaxID=685588 RepID=A0A067SS13_GALM3|nr:hypothetical protein GALMADRAFT_142201 [Galerina marginata CBS 339.88]